REGLGVLGVGPRGRLGQPSPDLPRAGGETSPFALDRALASSESVKLVPPRERRAERSPSTGHRGRVAPTDGKARSSARALAKRAQSQQGALAKRAHSQQGALAKRAPNNSRAVVESRRSASAER